MRVLQIKRTRLYKLIAAICIILPIVYLLASSSLKPSKVWKEEPGRGHMRTVRGSPVYVKDGPGNFEPKSVEKRSGPGEGGKKHELKPEQENEASQALSEYGMNMACSNEISLDRSIPDLRLEECKHWNYPEDLPRTSVIIVFHNEGWSTLMRTVHSVINRTPPQFLEEVLLVDDYSNKAHLKDQLQDYIEQFNGKVRLIRNKEREGLIRTRSRGAKEARGEIILFLDAHCEVGYNWLPPLVAPIYKDRTVMTVPVIDGIDHSHFEYHAVYQDGHHFRGIFEWGMLYKENELPQKEADTREYNSEPYKSPTHAGGLFAIDRAYFLEIGAYDPGLLVWGGENFELSFKIWQCGGSILWVPCSRVGHVYRSFMPYNFGNLAKKKKGPLITINYKRVIETWFDEKHKEFFYTREPLARFLDMGDISEQVALKERLQCKNFQWFMDNVAYDVYDKFPELPPNLHWGELRNVAGQSCMDTMGHGPPTLMGTSHCHGFGNNQISDEDYADEMLVRLNAKGQLAIGERCIDADSQGIKLVFCKLGTVNGPWEYDEESHTLLHHVHKKCAGLHPQTHHLALMPCDPVNTYQQWVFNEIHPNWS
ncbi:N-acetylgalactosaminyltransferase 7 isoform X1 [Macrosteles quadrilineatus]|uniref:N-acetylgalactosaminyltransferase 7 isoform X1 n=1 Tax=Macrosteles quadrilineatus TaxID=74068 RepID=UPI0023E22E4F|nr:N-acetylgalactosaminyltransferase 7 isoform X1 [Macrosteles quadrilineatus]